MARYQTHYDGDGTPVGVLRDADAEVAATGITFTDGGDGVWYAEWPDDLSAGVYTWHVYETTIAADTFLSKSEPLRWNGTTASEDAGGEDIGAYNTVEQANALASTIPPLELPGWNDAGNAAYLAGALVMASKDIDAQKYQGAKYDPTQSLQFPRVAYRSGAPVGLSAFVVNDTGCIYVGAVIWDWDSDAGIAVVPQTVRLAELYQADYILSGKRREDLDRQRKVLASQQVGQTSESYFKVDSGASTWGRTLCEMAKALLEQTYRLRSGEIL